MAHEKSETVSIEVDGTTRWILKDTVGANAGTTLGPKFGFATMEEANSFAKKRSASFDRVEQDKVDFEHEIY